MGLLFCVSLLHSTFGTMRMINKSQTIDIPKNCKVKLGSRKISVEGPRGKLNRDFSHLNVDLYLVDGGKKIKVEKWFSASKELAAIRSVYAHFPINVNVVNKTKVEIRNFLGQKIIFVIDCLEGVEAVRSTATKDELVISGNDIDNVSRTAALVQQATTVKRKDIRKFLDGIYVSEKGNVVK